MRADHGSGDEKPGDGGQTKLVKEKHHRDGDGVNKQQVAEDIVIGHCEARGR